MKEFTVCLDTIARVKNFVNLVNRFDNDFDLCAGRYIVDAKSIMGIFSLELEEPLSLQVHGEIPAALTEALADYCTPSAGKKKKKGRPKRNSFGTAFFPSCN